MRPILAIVSLTWREGTRGASLPLLAAALLVLVLLLPLLVLFGFGDEQRMIRELGAATLRLGALGVALLVGAGLAARDREQGALASYLARPLGPAGYLAGRFLGGGLLLGVLLLTLSVARVPALKGHPALLALLTEELYRTWLEGAVLLAAAALLGAALRPATAALGLLALFVAGHRHGPLLAALQDGGAIAGAAALAAAALVPDLGAIGADDGTGRAIAAPGALLLSFVAAIAYLCVAAAVASGRELRASGERGR